VHRVNPGESDNYISIERLPWHIVNRQYESRKNEGKTTFVRRRLEVMQPREVDKADAVQVGDYHRQRREETKRVNSGMLRRNRVAASLSTGKC
jgi:hypothetical protein